jgi:hypothetical protein
MMPRTSSVIGACGGVLGIACGRLFDWLQIDDVAGAFPVHGVCGIFGSLALALSATPLCGSDGPRGLLVDGAAAGDFVFAQVVGVVAIAAFAVVTSYLTCLALELSGRSLRAGRADELLGLDLVEHCVEALDEKEVRIAMLEPLLREKEQQIVQLPATPPTTDVIHSDLAKLTTRVEEKEKALRRVEHGFARRLERLEAQVTRSADQITLLGEVFTGRDLLGEVIARTLEPKPPKGDIGDTASEDQVVAIQARWRANRAKDKVAKLRHGVFGPGATFHDVVRRAQRAHAPERHESHRIAGRWQFNPSSRENGNCENGVGGITGGEVSISQPLF